MKKQILLLLLAIGLLFSSMTAISKDKKQEAKVDPAFTKFWKEFQSGVIKNDKEKIAKMISFPLREEFSNGIVNSKDFIKFGFDQIFNKKIKSYIKLINNISLGKVIKKVEYKFINIKDLNRKSTPTKFLPKGAEGYYFEIFQSSGGEAEFNDYYYFVKINGVYKLYAHFLAG
jgi:hypothetical protein